MAKLRSMRAVALGGVLSFFSLAAAFGQYPGMPIGAMGSAPGKTVPQTELTDKSAKGALDAYLAIKDKYGDAVPQTNSKMTRLEAFEALEGVNSITSSNGFSDTEDWHKTLISVAMAYGFAKEGKTGDLDKSVAKIRESTQIPEQLKQQMIALIAGARPSENNLAVVKSLMADDVYKEKLERISK